MQRVIADTSVYDRLLPRIVAAVEAQVTGDPADDATDVGPLVSQDAAERVEAWVQEAVEAGATVLAGGKRDGASYAPTVLADVPAGVTIAREEVFGPVLTVTKVDGEAAAFAAVNDSKYGLQAGVFTRDLQAAFRAHRALEVGGVVILRQRPGARSVEGVLVGAALRLRGAGAPAVPAAPVRVRARVELAEPEAHRELPGGQRRRSRPPWTEPAAAPLRGVPR
ncbi:NAD/NADP-dependent betaine aldehyde dehydrogenase [Streptomyces hirsutus]